MSYENSGFLFHEKLDKEILEKLYQSDLEFALEMFIVFTDVVDTEFSSLENSINIKDFSQIKQDAHKMKPMFTMVGLPHMTKICQEIETNALNSDGALVDNLYASLKNQQEEHFPILLEEIKRIKEYLNK